MTTLNTNQQAALDHAEQADIRWREAKRSIRKRAREFVEKELAMFSAARDLAVYEAVQLGVPQRRIGLDALHTSSPNTVRDILDRVELNTELVDVELAVKPKPQFSWSESEFMEAPSGDFTYEYRWLLAGDGFKNAAMNVAGVDFPAHEGYLYVRSDVKPEWMTIGAKAPEAALAWAEVNS